MPKRSSCGRINRLAILEGSDAGGRRLGGSGFEHGERNFYRLDAKTGMFRDGHERDRILMNYHLLAFDRSHLGRWQPEVVGNADYFFVFDVKLIEHIRQCDACGSDFFFSVGKIWPRAEILRAVGPVIRLVCDVKSRK